MDKYEYKLRSEELLKLIEEEKYTEAAKLADTIDWRRVKSISMLLRVAALYRVNRRGEDSRAVLQLAYERYPSNRSVVYSLCEVSIELDDVVAAIEYYKEFVRLAPQDIGVYTLRYRILEAQEANLEERISVLEELKRKDYQEEWIYELAYLYHRVGLGTRCVEECDDLILWFGEGPYVMKAMELKMLHAPLTAIQQKKYDMARAQLQGEQPQSEEPSYEEQSYGEQPYEEQSYEEQSYGEQPYEEPSYEEQSYSEQPYEEQSYEEPVYEETAYEEAPYDGQDTSQYIYTDDENNEYAYYEGGDEAYEEAAPSYEEEQPACEATVQNQNTGSLDMSQYNTINLQKVVAESMRELFPDDEDVFSEEWTEVSSEDTAAETIRVPSVEDEVFEETSAAEEAQEPEEQTKLPDDMALTKQPEFTSATSQMNIDEVLDEWERMKKEVEEKRKEEVKQKVLRQTGKIFQNFDEAVKTGILGELGEEEPVKEELSDETEEAEAVKEAEIPQEAEEPEALEEEEAPVDEDLEEEEPEEISALEQAVAEELGGRTSELLSDKQEDASEEYDDDAYDDEEEVYEPDEDDTEEDSPQTQEISMNTEEITSLSDKIVETTKKETKAVKREKIREFTEEERELFENFSVTKKIRKQIIFALDTMSLAAYTGNVLITGEPGLGTLQLAKNLIREYQATDANFLGKIAKITGEKLNLRDLKEVFDKLKNGAIIIEKANGLTEDTLYQLAGLLNQEELGIIVIMEDTKKEITRLLEKQAMIADYFNIRIDLMEMDNNALVAYAKNYAQALEYSIDELGTLALYTRIANSQSGNHVVTKDEVREIVDEAIWKSKKSKIKNFVDVLFSKRYDSEDMIVLKERDFI